MREVAIIGTGVHPFGRFDHLSLVQMCRKAVEEALGDAGVGWREIEAVVAGGSRFSGGYGWGLNGNEIVAEMGLTGVPVYNLVAACATGGSALNVAYHLVASGAHDLVLVVGGEKPPRGFLPLSRDEADPLDIQFLQFVAAGMTGPAFWAMLTRRRMHDYGTSEVQLAQVVVKARRLGALNPYARYRKEVSVEDVLSSPMVVYPLHLLEICAISDGAAAVVLASAPEARRRTSRPVWIAGCALSTAVLGDGLPKGISATAVGSLHAYHSEVARAVQKAMEMAGVSHRDIDFIELQDNSVYYELAFPEEWGFCQPGEGERLLERGETLPSGRLPINPSGGFLSFGEATTAMGIWQVCEVTWQLRGQAGPRQVPGAKVGLAQTLGLGSNGSALVLKR